MNVGSEPAIAYVEFAQNTIRFAPSASFPVSIPQQAAVNVSSGSCAGRRARRLG